MGMKYDITREIREAAEDAAIEQILKEIEEKQFSQEEMDELSALIAKAVADTKSYTQYRIYENGDVVHQEDFNEDDCMQCSQARDYITVKQIDGEETNPIIIKYLEEL